MGAKRKDYDDALIMAIARGDKTYAQIARELGLSESTVVQVAGGERRPDLQPRIQAVRQGFVDQTRRLAGAWAGRLMGKHIKDALEGDGETARKCGEYVLSHILGDPGQPAMGVNQQQYPGPDLTDLSPETKRLVLMELGGPLDEDDD